MPASNRIEYLYQDSQDGMWEWMGRWRPQRVGVCQSVSQATQVVYSSFVSLRTYTAYTRLDYLHSRVGNRGKGRGGWSHVYLLQRNPSYCLQGNCNPLVD